MGSAQLTRLTKWDPGELTRLTKWAKCGVVWVLGSFPAVG